MTLVATLYTTDHCQLCDTALDWLQQSAALAGMRLATVDVATSDRLLEQFGERVPVLALADQMLDWPFTEAGVQALIARSQE